MSALVTVDVEFKNRDAVIAALTELGYHSIKVDVDGKIPIYDREKDRINTAWGKAEVLVPHAPNGGYSDIGFVRQEGGDLRLVVTDVDQHHMCQRADLPCDSYKDPRRTASMGRLKQLYGKHATLAEAVAGSWNHTVVEEDGDIRIQLSRYA